MRIVVLLLFMFWGLGIFYTAFRCVDKIRASGTVDYLLKFVIFFCLSIIFWPVFLWGKEDFLKSIGLEDRESEK